MGDGDIDRSPFRSPEREPLLQRTVPLSQQLPQYRAPTAQRDLLAGLTVAALALPAALAYAELAGISPVHGLYALLLPMVVYALLGSSRALSIGPEGSIAALVAAAVLPIAAAGSGKANHYAATLALIVAVLFAIAWVAKLGWVADYLSRPVLIGYIHGVAIVLIISQLPKLLGVETSSHDPLPKLWETVSALGSVSLPTLALGSLCIATLLLLRRLSPRFPGQLLVVVATIALSWAVGLAGHGVAIVGTIPSGLPHVELPFVSVHDTLRLVPAAIGIFFLSFADEVLTARSFAGKRNQHVRVSQELLAMGAASAAAGVTQAFPIGASGSRTAVNDGMGARTQVAGLVCAAAVVAVLLFLTTPLAYLPTTVLAAVIVTAAVGLLDPEAWRRLAATQHVEVAIAAVTMVGVLTIGVLEAIVLAVGLAIVDVVRRSARPHDAVLGWVESLGRYADVSFHPSARLTAGVVVYRLDDRLFFANALYMKGRVQEAVHGASPPVHWLVFDAEAVGHIDSTGAAELADLTRNLGLQGVQLVVARLKHHPRQAFEDAGLTAVIGPDRFYPTVAAAVAACARSSGTDDALAPPEREPLADRADNG